MNKRTEELVNELKECSSISDYIMENESQFLELSPAEYIEILMKKKGLKKIDIVKHAKLSEVYTYQILAGMKNPDRDKLLCILFALKAEVAEADCLLRIAGKAELYAKNRRDTVIMFALSKQLSIDETNDLLYELEQETLL